MSYPEYTKCTSVKNALAHRQQGKAPWGEMIAAGISAGALNGTAATIIAAIVDAVSVALVAGVVIISILITALVAILTYCDWWLKYRLICLDDDHNHCVIGFVAEFEPPEDKTGFDAFDTDFSMNIGLVGTWFTYPDNDKLPEVRKVQPFGYLLESTKADDPTRAANDNITPKQIFTFDGTNSPGDDKWSPYFAFHSMKMKVLHTEFEGGGISTLRDWVRGLIVLLLVADALSVACSAGLFWACIVLILLAVFFGPLAITGLNLALNDKANPGRIDKSLESLSIGNIVLVTGRWVYDAGHIYAGRGWNEIHPIRHCQILRKGVFQGDWGAVLPGKHTEWCKQVTLAGSPNVKTDQKKPQHGWEIHPLIDGCVGSYEPPDKQGPRIDSVSNVAHFDNCSNDYTVSASATDPSGIAKVELRYVFSVGSWETKPMVLNSSSGFYEATIPGEGTVTYFVRAYSSAGYSTDSAQYSTFLFCVK